MRRRPTLVVSSVLALTILALPLTAGAKRAATSDVAVVNVAFNTKLKQQILVTGQGMTLYLWMSDLRDTPTCVDDPDVHCSSVWPPYRSTAPPVAGPGVNAALLKTVKRSDGGGWYVVSPLGKAVKVSAVSPSLSVHPTTVARGGRVTVSGRGCIVGDDVFLISTPFVGHAFVAHSVATQTRQPYGAFSRQVRIRTDVRPGRYAITARCGGANLGLAAHLRVH